MELIEATQNVLKSFKEGKIRDYMDVEPASKMKYRSYGPIPNLYKAYQGNVTAIFQAEYNHHIQKLNNVSDEKRKGMQRKIMKYLGNYANALTCYHHGQTGQWLKVIEFYKEGTYFFQTAIEMDKGKSKKYWSTNEELFARAFEAYVNLKLHAKNERNDYLVCGTADYVYPQKEEMVKIYHKFDDFKVQVACFLRGELK